MAKKEKLYTQKEVEKMLGEFERTLKTELRASEDNLKYQVEVTKNANLIREWQGTIFGIKLCLDKVRQRAKEWRRENG